MRLERPGGDIRRASSVTLLVVSETLAIPALPHQHRSVDLAVAVEVAAKIVWTDAGFDLVSVALGHHSPNIRRKADKGFEIDVLALGGHSRGGRQERRLAASAPSSKDDNS